MGLGGAVLHGLATFGFGARAVLKAVAGDDPYALKAFGVRFSSPVKPGGELDLLDCFRFDHTANVCFRKRCARDFHVGGW